MAVRTPSLSIVRTDAGFHIRLKAANGAIISTSEPYRDKRAARRALDLTAEAVLDGPDVASIRVIDLREEP